MSIMIFNIPGLLILLAGIGSAFALRTQWPHFSDNVIFAVAAVMCFGLDLLWRAGKGKRHWFRPNQGGNLFYLPLWILGAVALGVLAYHAYLGPIPALAGGF